eukprot:CAMPEP_0182438736 /NCGR_PEP_ID=MMETSP1167-20130531/85986_1 /TAXON_ID=2988 /ORGANISM="Mallomonas Sp, Strain CCMP3275" /LENGTH=154 /DNA_ID=CAMNT_0024632235 /DNA_START=1214 /DNA_END=1678 /DNA_ORIENTATION=-
MNIHPFALQVACRQLASTLLQTKHTDPFVTELLPSILQYAGFVDANALSYLWFEEFRSSRICVISGSAQEPIFTVLSQEGENRENLRDVILHCDGCHFTLLRPLWETQKGLSSFSVLPELLSAARAAQLVVMETEVKGAEQAVQSVVRSLLNEI